MIKFYNILKAMHLNYSDDYFTQAITHKNIKPLYTVSGTLPITLPTKPRYNSFDDWVIYGNAEGVGERTKNLLEITAETQTINGVTYTINDDRTVTVSGTATEDSNILLSSISGLSQGDYILSGEKDINTPTVYPYVRGGGETTKNDQSGTGVDFSMGNYTECKLYVTRYFSGTVTVKPMIRLANTSPDFIPYGYQVPITVSQAGQTDKNYDIFIGDTPLVEGETISQNTSETRITVEPDLETTISTTLENKPEMKIIYN